MSERDLREKIEIFKFESASGLSINIFVKCVCMYAEYFFLRNILGTTLEFWCLGNALRASLGAFWELY